LRARLVVDTELPGDEPAITSIAVEFRPDGAPVWIQAATAIDGSIVTVTVPDVDAKGFLRATVAWTTNCDAGQGSGQLAIVILHSSVAAGCPTTGEGLQQALAPISNDFVTFDALTVPIDVIGYSPRWFEGEFTSDFGQFSGWDRDAGITVARDASIVMREDVDELSLISVRAAFFNRADVEAYLDPDSTNEVNTVDVQRRSAGVKGRIGIPVRLDPGRYVMEVASLMQTRCADLQAYSVVSLDVR
jgi:hypothetical protein